MKFPEFSGSRVGWLAFAAAIVLLLPSSLWSAGGVESAYVPGDLVVKFRANPSSAEISFVEEGLSATAVKKLPVSGDWWLFRSKDPAKNTTEQMIVSASSISLIEKRLPSYYGKIQAIPNDTYYSRLYGMAMMRMPEAWNIQKGSASVKVAVLDTGVQNDHPDLVGRLVAGYDVADDDADTNPPAQCDKLDEWASHGSHVAGTIVAQGNNGQGVVGVCWDNVKVIPIKVVSDESTDGTFPMINIIPGLDEAIKRGAQVVNMSFGGAVPFEPVETKIKEAANLGIIMCASAGNDSGPVIWPAAYDECIAVSSVDSSGNLAPYSNFGPEIDVAAPGGDTDYSDPLDPEGIISTVYNCQGGQTPAHGYQSWQGTSMAAPHVSGVAALLLSNGVAQSSVRSIIEGSASPRGTGVPNNKYGYGIVDCYAALNYSAVTVQIERPKQGDVVPTSKPLVQILFAGASPTSTKVIIDGELVISGNVVLDGRVSDYEYNDSTGRMSFAFQFSGEGTHSINASGYSESDQTKVKSATVNFTIKGLKLTAGRYMFSTPFTVDSADPGSFFGTQYYRLARAVHEVNDSGVFEMSYALYNYPGIENDSRASLLPDDVHAGPIGSVGYGDYMPRGVGYWLDLRSPLDPALLPNDTTDDRYSYQMDVPSGWVQIGNPFPFNIAWGNVLVEYLGEILPVAKAADRGWISPVIYRYENNAYVSSRAPNGVLEPWKGYWIKVKVPKSGTVLKSSTDPRGLLTLTFIPLQVTSSATGSASAGPAVLRAAASTASKLGGIEAYRRRPSKKQLKGGSLSEFTLQFNVAQGKERSVGPTIGCAVSATDRCDILDVEAPPPAAMSAWAATTHSDWHDDSGNYMTDIRSVATSEQTWNIRVYTYGKGAVDLRWGNLEAFKKVFDMTMRDLATGEKINPLKSHYRFMAPSGNSVRDFTFTARRRVR